ncbi:S-layer homology domain-containing protein [Crassaminicella thermophila]|uniref:S-layer homology domain-containing protein n=1 Tax=Crassaminicella thermophila TaxID=2599308 RepID=A0A5C0SJ50_CRATE|nr:S-layer homology domain-containing protein [Crassaminicella thermophila]QEK13258.1 S-layer homology domain-containing protein [Crassaminicella thermophila]
MKKFIVNLLIISLLLIPTSAWATPPGFSGGVNNEYEYEEVVFLTGEPIKFHGTMTVSEREKENEKTTSYTFKLTPEDRSIDAKLDRKITFVTTYTKRNDKGQTIGQTVIDKYRETLKIGKDKYELEDYQLSQSDLIDNRPASDFYSGNLKARKYYKINKDEGEVIVDITGGDVGYENFWGSTETLLLDYRITSSIEKDDESSKSWNGTVKVRVSDSKTKTLRYSDNKANFSSFYGGHVRVTNREMVTSYDYNLPKIEDNEINDRRRKIGSIQFMKQMVPKVERLIIPKFKDIGGHWAEEYIKKLYSLDVFDENSTFFSPDIPFTRVEFIKGVMKACNMRTSLEEEKKTSRRRRNKPKEVSPFKDVKVEDKNYKYIKDAIEKRIISGVSEDLFAPNKPLTKAQAVTILIKALGFDYKAPAPGFYTTFTDDREIPNWAKDSIYIAREINLIQPDDYNRINPNKLITRAEASELLVRFLEFLQKDLQRDYREDIINFN